MENPLCRLSRDIKSSKAASIPLFVFGMSKAPVILEIAYVPLKTVIGASQIFMNVVRLASAPTLRSLKKEAHLAFHSLNSPTKEALSVLCIKYAKFNVLTFILENK